MQHINMFPISLLSLYRYITVCLGLQAVGNKKRFKRAFRMQPKELAGIFQAIMLSQEFRVMRMSGGGFTIIKHSYR